MMKLQINSHHGWFTLAVGSDFAVLERDLEQRQQHAQLVFPMRIVDYDDESKVYKETSVEPQV